MQRFGGYEAENQAGYGYNLKQPAGRPPPGSERNHILVSVVQPQMPTMVQMQMSAAAEDAGSLGMQQKPDAYFNVHGQAAQQHAYGYKMVQRQMGDEYANGQPSNRSTSSLSSAATQHQPPQNQLPLYYPDGKYHLQPQQQQQQQQHIAYMGWRPQIPHPMTATPAPMYGEAPAAQFWHASAPPNHAPIYPPHTCTAAPSAFASASSHAPPGYEPYVVQDGSDAEYTDVPSPGKYERELLSSAQSSTAGCVVAGPANAVMPDTPPGHATSAHIRNVGS
eukprot:3402450-Rhodomonas_salina.2